MRDGYYRQVGLRSAHFLARESAGIPAHHKCTINRRWHLPRIVAFRAGTVLVVAVQPQLKPPPASPISPVSACTSGSTDTLRAPSAAVDFLQPLRVMLASVPLARDSENQLGSIRLGSFLSSIAWIRVKMDAFAPIPNANVSMAVAVNPGAFLSCLIL
jgi:hypothetical protein